MRKITLFLLMILAWGSLTIPSEASPIEVANEIEIDQVKVLLERVYINNEVNEEMIIVPKSTVPILKMKYKNWYLVDETDEQIVWMRRVNDLSPDVKKNGYFGLSDDHKISIFDGLPSEERMIQTFFQVDVDRLEVDCRQAWKNGFRVKDAHHFLEVIKDMKKYAKE